MTRPTDPYPDIDPATRYLVVGGSGFLGGALVRALLDRGACVRSFDVRATGQARAEAMVGDLRQTEDVTRACAGIETVFHTASYVGWTPADDPLIEAINVTGTRHLLTACRDAGVRRFIYTSSIDAVFDGMPIRDGDERLPTPRRFLNTYSRTKAEAEQLVLAANDPAGIATCALRTAGIFGPGDRHRLPNILANARRGQSVRLGDGRAVFNHVYVTNVIHAHLLAAAALEPASPVAGQTYFIVDDPATNFYDFMEPFLSGLGYEPPTRTIPFRVAYALAALLEGVQRAGIRLPGTLAQLTRYTVASTCVDFSFRGDKAARDFGYHPVVDRQTAIAETLAWLRGERESQSES